jgi:hypothetical protein
LTGFVSFVVVGGLGCTYNARPFASNSDGIKPGGLLRILPFQYTVEGIAAQKVMMGGDNPSRFLRNLLNIRFGGRVFQFQHWVFRGVYGFGAATFFAIVPMDGK